MKNYANERTLLKTSLDLPDGNEQFKPMFMAVVVASIASLCVGYSIGYPLPYSTVITKSVNEKPFVALLEIGAIAGLFLGEYCIEKFGRKKGIMIAALFYIPGWILLGYFPNVTTLHVGRILTGIATGSCSLTVPIYIAEVSSFQFRGRLGVINQIGTTIGIFLAFLINLYGNVKQSTTAAVSIALVMGISILFVPEFLDGC